MLISSGLRQKNKNKNSMEPLDGICGKFWNKINYGGSIGWIPSRDDGRSFQVFSEHITQWEIVVGSTEFNFWNNHPFNSWASLERT